MRAMERLRPEAGAPVSRRSASDALSALFDMASEPSTAGSALAVLHELQMHQVELELQDEELRRSRAEMEATLRRQTQLYDHAPVAYFTVDNAGALRELNLTGAAMLGCVREQLLGRTLLAFLAPRSAGDLQAMVARLSDSVPSVSGTLELLMGDGTTRSMLASARRDPDGAYFLLALVDAAEADNSQAG
jgi:PAS domain S-box-containing protein